MKEKIKKLKPKFTLDWDYNGWRSMSTAASPYTQRDWNQTLATIINKASLDFFKQKDLRPDMLIVSAEISQIINDLEYFHFSDINKEIIDNIEKIGTFSGRFEVYCDPYLPTDKMYMTNKNEFNSNEKEVFCCLINVKNINEIYTNIENKKIIEPNKLFIYYTDIAHLDEKLANEYVKLETDRVQKVLGGDFKVLVIPVRNDTLNIEIHSL